MSHEASRRPLAETPNGVVDNNVDDATSSKAGVTDLAIPKTLGGAASASPIDHMLLVLADSALPLGSFAFSSGLESFIAHRRPQRVGPEELHKFLALSLSSISGTTLPYVLAAHRRPQDIMTLDNDFDASTLCQVARRMSVAQGRALIGVWERSLADSTDHFPNASPSQQSLKIFGDAVRASRSKDGLSGPSGHFPPLWGAVCFTASVPLATSAYIYLFKHAQAVLSAAVRASTIGPYQAQAILASKWLQAEIQTALTADWETKVEDAAQVVPIMDFWITLHDKLYTKIFSS